MVSLNFYDKLIPMWHRANILSHFLARWAKTQSCTEGLYCTVYSTQFTVVYSLFSVLCNDTRSLFTQLKNPPKYVRVSIYLYCRLLQHISTIFSLQYRTVYSIIQYSYIYEANILNINVRKMHFICRFITLKHSKCCVNDGKPFILYNSKC